MSRKSKHIKKSQNTSKWVKTHGNVSTHRNDREDTTDTTFSSWETWAPSPYVRTFPRLHLLRLWTPTIYSDFLYNTVSFWPHQNCILLWQICQFSVIDAILIFSFPTCCSVINYKLTLLRQKLLSPAYVRIKIVGVQSRNKCSLSHVRSVFV
jgi:hypothetical protein